MKPEVQVISKPIPEGLDCGDEFSEDEMIRIRMLREIIKSSECEYFRHTFRFCFKLNCSFSRVSFVEHSHGRQFYGAISLRPT